MQSNSLDSLLSVCVIEDFFLWEKQDDSGLMPINYDFNDRKRRQLIKTRYLENGSFYIFKPEILRQKNNRLGGLIGIQIMERFKMFQIDNMEDIELCEAIMKAYNLDIV
jgi:N-acylneuraminate cytidylyltransferase